MSPRPRDPRPAALLSVCLLMAIAQAQYLEKVIRMSGRPLDVLWNQAGNKVYVSTWAGLVTVIDGTTNEVLANIPVGDFPRPLCWNSVDNKVYVTNSDPDWLYIIDAVGDTLTNRVPMSGNPDRMAFNSTMDKVYIAGATDYTIRVYDGATDTVTASIRLGGSSIPSALLWHPVSNRVFCATYGSYPDRDTVFVIDCLTDAIVERLPLVADLRAMCRNPVNDFVYVAGQDTVCALDPAGDSVKARIPFGGYPFDVCAVPYANKVYVSSDYPRLYVIDCYTHTVVDTLAIDVAFLVCDTLKAKVYATGWPGRVLDARTNTLLTSIPGNGSTVDRICWNSTNSRVYWAAFHDTVIYVIRDPSAAVAEPADGLAAPGPRIATMVRGRLFLGAGVTEAKLLDIAGRSLMTLHTGETDVNCLAPGVYFVTAGRGTTARTTKVLVVRN